MSARAQTVEMVQTKDGPEDGPTPPEVSTPEAYQRLWAENQDLKVALDQSNVMLRKSHSEMMEFQNVQRREREFIAYKFNEARKLVEKLSRERDSLQAHLVGRRSSAQDSLEAPPVAPPTEVIAGNREMADRPAAEDSTCDQRLRAKLHEEANSPGSSMSSCDTLTPSICETIREAAHHQGLPRAEQDNVLKELQLLKEENLKLKQERNGLLGSPAANGEESEVRMAVPETEVLQGGGDRYVKKEQDLQEKLQAAERLNAKLQEQVKELQQVVSLLEGQQKEHRAEAQRQLQLLTEEKASVKAQVTSLLGELNESQMSLETSLQDKRKLEESLRLMREKQRELEVQMKQLVIQLDQRRLHVQNLETALNLERQNASEEMRKLAQLQAAYHKMFQEYDCHIKNGLQQEKLMKSMDHQLIELKQQLQEAEEALVAKQELIDKLKIESEEQKSMKETISVLKAQADIFRADFQAEREARARLHAEKEKLQEQLVELQRERTKIEDMRNRHYDLARPSLPAIYPHQYPNAQPPSFPPVAEPQEYRCPKCQYKAPDMDTLQIHVMDCIE
ncbi:NF-kappa-B essential modulator isoform X2 [Hyperolius riggenbachi]|uniref:NF-kappa-B essential modulator isoform X2 n=1 Tax=Hyperolius riggenbachi TaxID=752182 RepID=UPI0035A38514